ILADAGDPSSPSSLSAGNTIRDNTIDNIPFIDSAPVPSLQGRAISVEHNFSAAVTGNVITRAATGIQAIFTLLPSPSNAITEISDNVIQAYDRGILVYTQDVGVAVPTFAVTGNKVTAEATGATATNVGIDVVPVLHVPTG